jgi:hypothetical protein
VNVARQPALRVGAYDPKADVERFLPADNHPPLAVRSMPVRNIGSTIPPKLPFRP